MRGAIVLFRRDLDKDRIFRWRDRRRVRGTISREMRFHDVLGDAADHEPQNVAGDQAQQRYAERVLSSGANGQAGEHSDGKRRQPNHGPDYLGQPVHAASHSFRPNPRNQEPNRRGFIGP